MKIKLLPGFTLVEILVAIGIIGTLSGVGIASYTNFSRRELLNQNSKKLVQDLRLAQSLAMNNQKPSGCSQLLSYIFQLNSRTYLIYAECVGGCPSGCSEASPVKSDNVSGNLTLTGFTLVKFKILNQGIETTGGSTLNVTGFGKTNTITINPGGTISL